MWCVPIPCRIHEQYFDHNSMDMYTWMPTCLRIYIRLHMDVSSVWPVRNIAQHVPKSFASTHMFDYIYTMYTLYCGTWCDRCRKGASAAATSAVSTIQNSVSSLSYSTRGQLINNANMSNSNRDGSGNVTSVSFCCQLIERGLTSACELVSTYMYIYKHVHSISLYRL